MEVSNREKNSSYNSVMVTGLLPLLSYLLETQRGMKTRQGAIIALGNRPLLLEEVV